MRLDRHHWCVLLVAAQAWACSSKDDSSSKEDDDASSNESGTNDSNGSGDSGGSGGSGGSQASNDASSNNESGADTTSGSGGSGDTDGSGSGGDTSAASGNGDTGGSAGETSGSDGPSSTGTTGGNGTDDAKEVAAHLGREHFLIGMGNDLAQDHNNDGAYTLGVTLDVHYVYLVGLPGQGGWPDWNAGGTFVNIMTDTAKAHGTVPMFTTYSMAAQGENNLAVLTEPNYMGPFWEGFKLLFERLAEFGDPSVVHLEPDFWAYAQHAASNPADLPVLVGSLISDCEDLPENMVGMGNCLIRLAREGSPETLIGFHASAWAADTPEVARYLKDIGGDQTDLVFVEVLDRDAGCFEAAVDPNCQRGGGPWYWDETNQTSPNFHEHLAWAKAISDGVGKPLMWWQMPFGVPSDTPGGTAEHYRDNRVKYLFEHVDEFVAAGGVGAAFGVGTGNQTYITSDGGQFQDAVTNYYADPYQL